MSDGAQGVQPCLLVYFRGKENIASVKQRIEALRHSVEANPSLLDSMELAMTGMCNLVLPMVRAKDWKSAEEMLNEFIIQAQQFSIAAYSGTASQGIGRSHGANG